MCSIGSKPPTYIPPKGSADCELALVCDRVSGYEATHGALFAGIVGNMLERILSAPGVEIPFESVYAISVVPWRLPRDRFPRRHEIASRRNALTAELEKVQPSVIVALGGLSAYALFADRPFEPGEWREWGSEAFTVPVYHTLHPREALWNHIDEGRFIADTRSKKRRMWDDWRAIAEKLTERRQVVYQADDESKENR